MLAGFLFTRILSLYKDYILPDPLGKRALSGCKRNPVSAGDYLLPPYLGKLTDAGWRMSPVPPDDYLLPSYLGKLRGPGYVRRIYSLLLIKPFLDAHDSSFIFLTKYSAL